MFMSSIRRRLKLLDALEPAEPSDGELQRGVVESIDRHVVAPAQRETAGGDHAIGQQFGSQTALIQQEARDLRVLRDGISRWRSDLLEPTGNEEVARRQGDDPAAFEYLAQGREDDVDTLVPSACIEPREIDAVGGQMAPNVLEEVERVELGGREVDRSRHGVEDQGVAGVLCLEKADAVVVDQPHRLHRVEVEVVLPHAFQVVDEGRVHVHRDGFVEEQPTVPAVVPAPIPNTRARSVRGARMAP